MSCTNVRTSGVLTSGASAACGGRGAQICSESSAVQSAVPNVGEAQTRPSRCPGIQYDLENEKRWTNVVRQCQSVGPWATDAGVGGEKR